VTTRTSANLLWRLFSLVNLWGLTQLPLEHWVCFRILLKVAIMTAICHLSSISAWSRERSFEMPAFQTFAWFSNFVLGSHFLQLACVSKGPSVLWHCWLVVRKSIGPVKKLSDEVLAKLYIWSEMQVICVWSSWCQCHRIVCFIKIQIGLIVLVPVYPDCPGKKGREVGVWLGMYVKKPVVLENIR